VASRCEGLCSGSELGVWGPVPRPLPLHGPSELTEMPRCKTFTAAVLAGALLTAAAIAQGTFAQGTARWTTGTPMPSSRTEIAVAQVGGKIYVVGGFHGERELEIYDPSTDRWSRGASIPRAVHHAGARWA
jgi:hypothetical protein